MKSKFYILLASSFILIIITIVSCNKDLDFTETLKPLTPADLDADAENWAPADVTTMTLTSITNIVENSTPKVFNPPADITSDAYVAELAAIKGLQSNLTNGQRKAISYWSGGGVIRWNQFLRELVARYNLPPEPVNGAYPVPDAENPFSFPQFPFCNPPYAARAYSYVSVAQYEALKTAWHYMHLYNRPSPHKNDVGIKSLAPETELPSYPSYDAVLSGVSAEMLKLLFPSAVEEITMKAAEQRNAALWSGKASPSDIAAGLALGKSVATLYINRAKGDKMGVSGGDKAKWKAFADAATAKNEIPWKCLENPVRPPMLPFFGLRTFDANQNQLTGVKAWRMDNGQITSDRPGPPPPTGSAKMNEQLAEVKHYSDNLTRERLAIVHKWADGVGTYTPAGHWNDIATEYIRDADYSEVRAARAYALLNMAMHDAGVSCWDSKFFYFSPRPCQLDPTIKTGTGIPNFPAYVSGHSTFSSAASVVLSHLFPAHTAEFEEMAHEAGMSRLYAAIHYRADIEEGAALGERVGGHTVYFAGEDGAE